MPEIEKKGLEPEDQPQVEQLELVLPSSYQTILEEHNRHAAREFDLKELRVLAESYSMMAYADKGNVDASLTSSVYTKVLKPMIDRMASLINPVYPEETLGLIDDLLKNAGKKEGKE